ncbi:hypothetical protein Clacol_008946 [Clathrus columnatus]|uniref:Uncharacterized protein n=1 Tax=Clathrus columnatus TaxID=1419009 RepID=A0AAV5AS14_9AGAM|nr:hypothetical protein Clacol_008946 [Clathrus columnatus]
MNYKNSDYLLPPNSSLLEDKVTIPSPGSSVFDLPSTSYEPPRLSTGKVEQNPSIPELNASEPIDFSLLVISGGTGANSLCSAFGSDACYVLPVSDDGGSSSEIIRVVGGPSVGDIRSRLIRLIPTTTPDSPLHAIRTLLSYRLPCEASDSESREEWRSIVEGLHPLWKGIPSDRKEAIRGKYLKKEQSINRFLLYKQVSWFILKLKF